MNERRPEENCFCGEPLVYQSGPLIVYDCGRVVCDLDESAGMFIDTPCRNAQVKAHDFGKALDEIRELLAAEWHTPDAPDDLIEMLVDIIDKAMSKSKK